MKTHSTIDDVALIAGVSKATVSRVFNDSTAVSPATRERVLAAIVQLEYTPNLHARKLAGGSGTIALVLQESVSEFFANPFWRDVVDGFVSTASVHHQHPVLLFHAKHENHDTLIRTLTLGNYDSVAFFGWHGSISRLEADIPENIRVVFGGRQGDSYRFTYVGANNYQGGILATTHLIQRGCRKILTITGDLEIESGRERLQGYRQALQNHQIPLDKELVLQGDYSEKSVRAMFQDFLKKEIKFDGIFAANDLMAIEAIRILSEQGICVPAQVQVIGFDDIPQAASCEPPLSTVHQPSYQLGQTVAEQLLQRTIVQLTNIELPLTVIARGSTL